MKQFEIWWAELPRDGIGHVQHGHRPVIIVSNDLANLHSPVISAVPLTTKRKKCNQPTHVLIRGYGLRYPSEVLCESIFAIDKELLKNKLGMVTAVKDQGLIKKALAVQLDLVLVDEEHEHKVGQSVSRPKKEKLFVSLHAFRQKIRSVFKCEAA